VLVPKPNRWHPVMLPDDYFRRMKQDLAEADAMVQSKTRYEPDPDFSPRPPTATSRLDMPARSSSIRPVMNHGLRPALT
jgi:hypothetical protein